MQAAPERRAINIVIALVEEERVAETVQYLFWRTRSLLGRFHDFLTGFFEILKGILDKISSMLKSIVDVVIPQRLTVLTSPQIVVVTSAPKAAVMRASSSFKSKTVGAVVAASSSPISNNSLKDATWLGYFEKNPEKARTLIEQAIQQDDFEALALIRQDKDQYPQLNIIVDQSQMKIASR